MLRELNLTEVVCKILIVKGGGGGTNLIPSVHSRKIEYVYTGFVQVMENVESHGIKGFHFAGLERHGI